MTVQYHTISGNFGQYLTLMSHIRQYLSILNIFQHPLPISEVTFLLANIFTCLNAYMGNRLEEVDAH